MQGLRGLNKGKAGGLQADSLDLFIKLARNPNRGKKKKTQFANKRKTMAHFFTSIANGEVPDKIGRILRTTYLVALQKDPDDLSKLRPLGVPSAIRRITAVLLLMSYRSRFAEHLLPFNYAIGVNGGIDMITNTVRLGVDKFIKMEEQNNQLPTRALVSLDIRNMFNEISRQKLREIIEKKYPELQSFADLLYEQNGKTGVKMADGSWNYIPVQEGFSQGCPMSPVFAALVLGELLQEMDTHFRLKAASRLSQGAPMDYSPM